MKRILVTGGAGFIGSHTIDLLLAKELNVVVYDNFSAGKLANLNVFHPALRVVQGDILDYSLLAKEVAQSDAVLHLAALPSVPKSIEDPVNTLKVNTLGFLHVLQAIREAKKPIRLVYASSAAVYGNTTELPCSENHGVENRALSPYALEKTHDENYAKLFAHLSGIQSLGLRYFNVYGLRQDPNSPYSGVISRFISNYHDKTPITVFGNGQQSRDFIHVTDVARANWLALQSDYQGVLNIATGVPETLLNLIRYIESAGGHSIDMTFSDMRAGDIRESYAQVEKAKTHLQFQYEIALVDGVKSMI